MRHKFFLPAVVLSGIVLCAGIFLSSSYGEQPYKTHLRTQELAIETKGGTHHRFIVEVADKPLDREVGLMHRDYMPEDHGMIFIFDGPPEIIRFWMKNTLIPLDMIFIDDQNKIAHIHENATPLSLQGISSTVPVVAVLEINGGQSSKRDIQVGDKVIFTYVRQ